MDNEAADFAACGLAFGLIDAKLAPTGNALQCFLQNAHHHVAHRFFFAGSTPACRIAVHNEMELIFFLFDTAALVADLVENARQGIESHLQFATGWQELEGYGLHAGPRPEV